MFGKGSAYEVDVPQIIKDYDNIGIREDKIIFFKKDNHILISKNETLFDDLPPRRDLVAGSSESFTSLYEDENTKLYEVTHSFSYLTPNGGETQSGVSYALYRKDNNCTLEITGDDKDQVLKISSIILKTKKYKTLEEQFYGITVLDDRIVDTSKVTIKEIYSVDSILYLYIKVDDSLVGVRLLSKKDKTYLPVLKNINNWRLIDEENNYKIYHGYTSGVDSDALKITKNNADYYIDLSLPYGKNRVTVKKVAQELMNILE